jgi:phage baseplate assembly protein W
MADLYRGFSTKQWETTNLGFRIKNKEAVKRDLLNHIFTSKGERVMMPNFGTRIPSLPFEPIDEITMRVIEEDIREVINFDPRVGLLDLKILPLSDNNAIVAVVTVKYIELGGVETFNIDVPVGSG